MNIFRYSSLVVVLVTAFFCLDFNLLFAHSDQKDMYCDGWLQDVTGDAPTEKDPNESNRTFIKDRKGVKGVCRRKFPTVGEREMLYRKNMDPFKNTYVVRRQYCWYFFDWFGFDKCGEPSIKKWVLFVPIFTWHPPSHTNWGDNKQVEFDINDVGTDVNSDSSCKSIYGAFNHACVIRVGPGEKFPDDKVNEENKVKICAYYKSGWGFFIGKGDVAENLIGCIDEPFKPRPPVFNKVIMPTKFPLVNTDRPLKQYINLKNSRFDRPVISMYLKNTRGIIEQELDLVYQFPGDRDSDYANKRCKHFKDFQVNYCAKVPENNPSQVCVCQKGQCGDTPSESISFLGCVPRPSPADSNIVLRPEYKDRIQEDGSIFPSLSVKFHDTKQNKDLKLSIDKLMEFYGSKQVLPPGTEVKDVNQKGDNTIWNFKRDSQTAYGVTFNTIIPQGFNNKTDSKMMEVEVISPDALQRLSRTPGNKEGDKKCHFYAEKVYSFEGGDPLVLPAQNASKTERERGMCKSFDHSDECIIKSKTIQYSYNADLASCPGFYVGVGSTQRQICLQISDDWKEFFTSTVCADIPLQCRVIDNINNISNRSGYAIWNKSQDVDSSTPQTGQCGTTAQGFEQTTDVSMTTDCMSIKIYKTSPKSKPGSKSKKDNNTGETNANTPINDSSDTSGGNSGDDSDSQSKTEDTQATKAAQNECMNKRAALDKLKQAISDLGMYVNVPRPEDTKYIKYNINTKPPQRKCNQDGTMFGAIDNPCRFTSNCAANTEAIPATGNALWKQFLGNIGDKIEVTEAGDEQHTLNIKINSHDYKGIQSDVKTIGEYNIADILIEASQCSNGTVAPNTQRVCRVLYDNNNKIAFAGWTDTILGEKCSK